VLTSLTIPLKLSILMLEGEEWEGGIATVGGMHGNESNPYP